MDLLPAPKQFRSRSRFENSAHIAAPMDNTRYPAGGRVSLPLIRMLGVRLPDSQ